MKKYRVTYSIVVEADNRDKAVEKFEDAMREDDNGDSENVETVRVG